MKSASDQACQTEHPPVSVPLRAPDTVMRLARLGSFHQTRLSFMRVLLRRLATENWQFERTRWEIDGKGEGVAVYEARGNGRVYSLVAFSHDLDPAKRTDRVIAEEWDATFALHDGPVSAADIERLSRNVPKQEAGRCSDAEIVLARANKSVRLFDQVVGWLAAGLQPDAAELDAVGYLMRTTAVYGSGKFGMATYQSICGRPEFSGPFGAEMLTVWLIRAFTVDLVEHVAFVRAPLTAVPLERDLRRRLGVGNSTGLGMAPFLVNHPALVDRWIGARETALARVRSLDLAFEAEIAVFREMLRRGRRQMAAWNVDDAIQTTRIEQLRRDLDMLARHVETIDLTAAYAWDGLYRFAEEKLGLEAQEFLVTLLLEPYGPLVDDLAETMAGDEENDFPIDGAVTVAGLAEQIDSSYQYALETDFDAPAAQARFWYVSEEKLEPRLGERADEDGAEREQPLAVARDVKALREALRGYPAEMSVAGFLLECPVYRHVVRRVQLAALRPYAEIRDNLIGATLRPIDLLRCKLSFFGATNFDPRSDRWVRIALFRGAPFPDEFHHLEPDDWAIPSAAPRARRVKQDVVAAPLAKMPVRHGIEKGLSLNEFEALVRKAARGAGLSWGLAEEAGWCARALAAKSQNVVPTFIEVLEAHRAGDLTDRIDALGRHWRPADHRPISPLVLGPALADHALLLRDGGLRVEGPVSAPLLLLPFLASVARRLDQPLHATTDAVRFVSPPGNWPLVISELMPVQATGYLELALSPRAPQAAQPVLEPAGPVPVPADLIARLEALAALTYVPSSEKSRSTGAGAGLSDND